MNSESKIEAYEFGLFAEEMVAEAYIKKGYTILERRWKVGKTEIDLIAQKDNIVVIIEVKARSGKGEDALSTVTSDKRKRMVKAADVYLKRLEGQYDYRFDIATVTGNKSSFNMDIFEDAFVSADIF